MDKSILDKLIKFGFVTNVNVDASKYKDVDDLINKGVVTVPGAKSKIMELLEKANIEATEDVKMPLPETVVEVKEDDIVEVIEVDETEAPVEEIVDAVEVVEETVIEETPVEEVVETPEETSVEETPKKKKSTKKKE